MAEIIKNRTIRPSSRKESSDIYKINTENVKANDTLIVNINHESNSFSKSFKFSGSDVANRNSIHFKARETYSGYVIIWNGAQPIKENATNSLPENTQPSVNEKPVTQKRNIPDNSSSFSIKSSFEAISNPDSKILILGTLPGDKSIQLGEYYGHPGNRFWKILAAISNQNLPLIYQDKKALLYQLGIAVWDVAHSARRAGSLDSAIGEEIPNGLESFIKEHKKLDLVCFNGQKAEALYDKYFPRFANIQYLSLPSTSPANMSISFDRICKSWQRIFETNQTKKL